MTRQIEILDLGTFDSVFGEVGLKVGPRTGPDKRTKDEKEWYVVRHFLKTAIAARLFQIPVVIRQGVPPEEPDFVANVGNSGALLEITEATNEADQREMTEFERSGKLAMLQGELGGRFSGGASQPGIAWAADVVDAIKRKAGTAIFRPTGANRHLVIYPNSNASSLIFDDEDEREAINFLQTAITSEQDELKRLVDGCLVHILAKEHLLFDVVGKFEVYIRPQ
jgi:hypothetical protein